jgi:hypothetical protein
MQPQIPVYKDTASGGGQVSGGVFSIGVWPEPVCRLLGLNLDFTCHIARSVPMIIATRRRRLRRATYTTKGASMSTRL